MRWGGGLFRLWLLLALVWVGWASYGVYQTWDPEDSTGIGTLPSDLWNREQFLSRADKSCRQIVSGPFLERQIRHCVDDINKKFWLMILAMIYRVFSVPLIVLFAGLSLRWVLNGFKRREF